MGIADLIPGVSGGTIAFITGIYQRLLAAITVFSQPAWWQALLRLQWRRVWQLTDVYFLLALFGGILSAVLLFSKLLHYLLSMHAHLLLGFFFGLVLASIVAVSRRVHRIRAVHILLAAIATLLTLYTVSVDTLQPQNISKLALFAGGMVAICAMILPGISGSYILLILGLYPAVITAVHERDIVTLLVVAAGCGIGLLLFSRVLGALLKRFYTATMMVLVGIMIGASPKLWPWKEAGEGVKIILQKNVMPAEFAAAPDIALVSLLTVSGFLSVLALEWISVRRKSASTQ